MQKQLESMTLAELFAAVMAAADQLAEVQAELSVVVKENANLRVSWETRYPEELVITVESRAYAALGNVLSKTPPPTTVARAIVKCCGRRLIKRPAP